MLLVSHLIDMENEFRTTHVTKTLILCDGLSINKQLPDNVCIEVCYKKVYHSIPSADKQQRSTSSPKRKSLRKDSNIIDLTESDSEESSINKTYTLLQHEKCVDHTAETSTQTKNVSSLTIELPVKVNNNLKFPTDCNSSQTDTIPSKIYKNIETQTEINLEQKFSTLSKKHYTKNKSIANNSQMELKLANENYDIEPKKSVFDRLDGNDFFKAKITIVCGYNFPMVKLNGDTKPTAPTTYIIMDNFRKNCLSTPTVVQDTDPVWNSEWTVVLPKNVLIEVCITNYT